MNEDTPASRDGGMGDADRLYQEARGDLDCGATDPGMEKLRQSARFHPHFKTYELLGECLLEKGEEVEAVLYLSAAAGLEPRQQRSRYLLARALMRLGQPLEAAAQLQQVVAHDPGYRGVTELLAEIEHLFPGVMERLPSQDAEPR